MLFGKFFKNILKSFKTQQDHRSLKQYLNSLHQSHKNSENKYGSPKGTETLAICFQTGALWTEREIRFQPCISFLNKIHLVSFNLSVVHPNYVYIFFFLRVSLRSLSSLSVFILSLIFPSKYDQPANYFPPENVISFLISFLTENIYFTSYYILKCYCIIPYSFTNMFKLESSTLKTLVFSRS